MLHGRPCDSPNCQAERGLVENDAESDLFIRSKMIAGIELDYTLAKRAVCSSQVKNYWLYIRRKIWIARGRKARQL